MDSFADAGRGRPAMIGAPAKINVFLAVTGRRPDGFHDLLSVAVPLASEDTLEAAETASANHPRFLLECDDPAVPADGTNLVLRAAEAFRAATGWDRGVRFSLKKRLPMGAGLGGGSSDAASALLLLNRLAGHPLTPAALTALAAQIGSDCPLFLAGAPVILRGRGETIVPLPPAASSRLGGRRVLVFKPGFPIPTPWAYARLAARAPASYVSAAEAEARLARWISDPAAPLETLLFNSMERAAFPKFIALPALLAALRAQFGLHPLMTGSGSACFAFLPESFDAAPLNRLIQDSWGPNAAIIDTRTRS